MSKNREPRTENREPRTLGYSDLPSFPHHRVTMSSCHRVTDEVGHCITCSDEGVPMRVVAAGDGALAVCVDEGGSRSEVMTDLVGDVGRGDVVLVHAGVALAHLTGDGELFSQ